MPVYVHVIEHPEARVLVDTGMTELHPAVADLDPRLHPLSQQGFDLAGIDIVVNTLLHFDHCGGSVLCRPDGVLELAFPNATYWSNEAHWDWAVTPNPREKASFLKENILPIQESGHLKFVNPQGSVPHALPQFREIIMADGHTEKMMVPLMDYKGRTLAFMADLLPSAGHVPLPYVMSYDVRPLITMTEKEAVLRRAAAENWVLLLEHDPTHEACTVQLTDKGIRLAETLRLADL